MTDSDLCTVRKKHIAMYIGSLQKGGAERVMTNLAEYFYQQGFMITLVTTYIAEDEYVLPHATWHVQTPDEPAEHSEAIPIYTVDEKNVLNVISEPEAPGIQRIFVSKCDLSCVKASPTKQYRHQSRQGRIAGLCGRFTDLRNIWKKLSPDLILSFSGKNNIMAVLTSRGLGIPTAVSVRSDPAREYPQGKMRAAMKLSFKMADCVILQTSGAMDFFPEYIRRHACILPNSIKPDFIRPVFSGKRDRTIISVGRLDDNKDQQLLIHAFAKLAKEPAGSGYRLVIYGDGPDRDKLEKLAESLELADRINFEGSVSNVADRIAAAGIFVLSSRQEGMPNALIEAMALGIPCISTDCPCGGPADLIQDGVNGLLTPVGDEDKMADCIERLISLPDKAAELGRNASKVQELYSPDLINEKWKETLLATMKK